MSAFDDLIDEYLGDGDALTDIVICTRKLWFYDFNGYPVRVWAGKGKLFTTGDVEWLGSIDANNRDIHNTPPIQDGRDGSSATYTFSLTIPTFPDQSPRELYEALKADQSLAVGRNLTCYLAVFKEGEALRPTTPIRFFKQLTMFSPKFSERTERDGQRIKEVYTVSIPCKDANSGRSNTPNGTYADSVQKRRAAELGVALDRGSEFLALLANRTYQIP